MKILIKIFFFLFKIILNSYLNISNEQLITVNELVKKGILFYKEYRNNAETDIQKIIFEIGLINKTLQIYWDKIFKFWKFIDNSLIINKEEISLDIIDDNSLCLIVLGYQLFPNGTMQQELYERLEIV
jgi:hypothetical protein